MYCDVCGQSGGLHRAGCPEGHSSIEKAKAICCECHEGIYVDDEYIENEHGDVMHYDCSYNLTTRLLIDWLGFEIKRMEDYD